jgi:hypothetical protein
VDRPKSVEAWEKWLGTLSPEAQAALAGEQQALQDVDDAAEAYAAWRDTLSSPARRAVDSLVSQPPEPETNTSKDLACFCAVEVSNNGDWPSLRLFKLASSVVKHMAALEGTDTSLFVFYGVRMPYTKGPRRYLLLPDHTTALSVPVMEGEAPVQVDFASLDNVEVQEDNYLGCKGLSETDAGPVNPVGPSYTPNTSADEPPGAGDDAAPAR